MTDITRIPRRQRILRIARSTWVILTIASTIVGLAGGYFLYTNYNDQVIQSLSLSCMGISPNYDAQNYALVAGFNNPAPWRFHTSWLVFIKANVTGGSVGPYYFYINGTGLIESGNMTSLYKMPLNFRGLASSNFTIGWRYFIRSFTTLSITLTEDYTPEPLGIRAYNIHRFSELPPIDLQSPPGSNTLSISPASLASELQFGLRTHFNQLLSIFPHAQLCPDTQG